MAWEPITDRHTDRQTEIYNKRYSESPLRRTTFNKNYQVGIIMGILYIPNISSLIAGRRSKFEGTQTTPVCLEYVTMSKKCQNIIKSQNWES